MVAFSLREQKVHERMARPKTRRSAADKAAALAAISSTDVKTLTSGLDELRDNLQATMAGLGVAVAQQFEEFDRLGMAIEERRAQLSQLHEIEVEADTLAELQQEHEDFLQARDKAEKGRLERWEEEEDAHNANLQREQAQHEFDIAQRNARATSQLATDSQKRQHEEQVRMLEVSDNLNRRIAEVEAQEVAIAERQQAIDEFPAKLATAVEEARVAVTDSLTRAFGHEKALLKKDASAAEQLATAEKCALMQQVADLTGRITQLADELTSARSDAKAIAEAAVEASSQRQVASSLRDAMETQAQSSPGRSR
jgi:uncharacterized phage infection (PIP) family protein YhgE